MLPRSDGQADAGFGPQCLEWDMPFAVCCVMYVVIGLTFGAVADTCDAPEAG